MQKFNKPSGKSDGKKKPFRSDKGSFRKKGDSSRQDGKRDGFKPKKSFNRDGDSDFKKERKYSGEKSFSRDKKSYDDKGKRPFKRNDDGAKSFKKENRDFKEKRPFKRDNDAEKELTYKQKRSFTRNKELRKSGPKKDEGHFRGNFERKRSFSKNDKYSDKGEKFKRSFDESKKFDRDEKKPFKRKYDNEGSSEKRLKYDDLEQGKGFTEYSKEKKSSPKQKSPNNDGLTRLNKYLANAGIASRREADTLIKSGVVKVNGVPVTEMGFKVKPGDVVTYGDANVKSERKVYLLLNKPKDYITTVDDPQERKTVMDLIEGACKERIYPVGRLDRNTTGLLLFTNDGELTKKLTHPKHQIKKVYHVSLSKGLKPEHFKDIMEGIELEDGVIAADDLAFIGEGKKEVGIEIHSGRNRIVRRIFEHLGYEVLKLDRVSFAGLTKKDLPRGKYRFLNPKEVGFLQMIG